MPLNTFYLLFFLPALSLSEVTSFKNCPQFFFRGKPPTILQDLSNINRYAQICQCLLDQNGKLKFFYATLYDTNNKIPVYSAYEFHQGEVNREDPWSVEPMLEGGNVPCMTSEAKSNIPSIYLGTKQARNRDYEKSGYDKGHLFPVSHTDNKETMLATSTLTNAAPQNPTFNRGQWKSHEGNMITRLQICSQAFIVTGVIPGNTAIGNNVRVAKYYWSTYCCFMADGTTSSAGFIGPDNNGKVQELTVTDLEIELQKHYGKGFSVGSC